MQIGNQIEINGRAYTISANLGIGEATAKCCPWITGQYGIEGKRGAIAMMMIFTNGTGRLVFTTARKVENFLSFKPLPDGR